MEGAYAIVTDRAAVLPGLDRVYTITCGNAVGGHAPLFASLDLARLTRQGTAL